MLFQELEAHFENTKHELQVTQEALAKFQSSQQVSFIALNYHKIYIYCIFIPF